MSKRGLEFQSTPPARGATFALFLKHLKFPGISIHAPREGGDFDQEVMDAAREAFQSTPPARGATLTDAFSNAAMVIFQSTPPARGATYTPLSRHAGWRISIHAPREGGDFQL